MGCHLINALTGKGPATGIIEQEDGDAGETPKASERLRELEELRRDALIDGPEYQVETAAILKEV